MNESVLEGPSCDTQASQGSWRDQARSLVGDLWEPSPAIYWTDFLLSAGLTLAATTVYFMAAPWSALQIAAFLLAGVLMFRAATFIHEIVHMPQSQMIWFKRVWNLLIGVPLLMPWILYRNHIEHHSPRIFGTPDDGEYLPLASSPVGETLKYLAQAPLLPLLAVVRFGVLGPLSWLHPGLRQWVLTRASAGVTNPHYRKRFPEYHEAHLKVVEAMCFAWLATIGVLAWHGTITPSHLLMAYLLMTYALGLNWIRNLAAHGYGNAGTALSHSEQVVDSINLTGQTWLTVALFPVGLRYHALHHLFPALPYHNLGAAHRCLAQHLPPDSPYRTSSRRSYFETVGDLWRSARKTSSDQSAMRKWRPDRPGLDERPRRRDGEPAGGSPGASAGGSVAQPMSEVAAEQVR